MGRKKRRYSAHSGYRRARRRLWPVLLLGAAVLVALCIGVGSLMGEEAPPAEDPHLPEIPARLPEADMTEEAPIMEPEVTGKTVLLGEQIDSDYAVVVDRETGKIVAQKNADAALYPASMTKVLSLIVAVEEIEDLDAEFTMTSLIIDPYYTQGATTSGLNSGESVPLRDLLYGMILPSGADAAHALAQAACGSQEAFVAKMNEKIDELGLSDTAHFANPIGLYDEQQYCTARDMAVIMECAMRDELCREVLSTMYYTTTETEQHPEGVEYTNLYLYRIEGREMNGAQVFAGKTGYVDESGSCVVSCGKSAAGREYIVVTGAASSSWEAIYDHIDLYRDYAA